jgi:hypothetical protein
MQSPNDILNGLFYQIQNLIFYRGLFFFVCLEYDWAGRCMVDTSGML